MVTPVTVVVKLFVGSCVHEETTAFVFAKKAVKKHTITASVTHPVMSLTLLFCMLFILNVFFSFSPMLLILI